MDDPAMIKYLCLVYLNQNKDEFDPNNTNDKIKIDGMTVTAIGCGVSLATRLKNIVNTGCHIWRFKCGSKSECGIGDIIGIISNDISFAPNHYFGSFTGSYGFAVAGNLQGALDQAVTNGNYARRCEMGDILEMTVDFNELTLSYKINDIDYGKAFDIKCGEYRAEISMFAFSWEPKSCYTLTSYQHIY